MAGDQHDRMVSGAAQLPEPLSIISVELLIDVLCFIDSAETHIIDPDYGQEAVQSALLALEALDGSTRVDFLRIIASLGEGSHADLGRATGTLDISRLEHRIGFLSDLLERLTGQPT